MADGSATTFNGRDVSAANLARIKSSYNENGVVCIQMLSADKYNALVLEQWRNVILKQKWTDEYRITVHGQDGCVLDVDTPEDQKEFVRSVVGPLPPPVRKKGKRAGLSTAGLAHAATLLSFISRVCGVSAGTQTSTKLPATSVTRHVSGQTLIDRFRSYRDKGTMSFCTLILIPLHLPASRNLMTQLQRGCVARRATRRRVSFMCQRHIRANSWKTLRASTSSTIQT